MQKNIRESSCLVAASLSLLDATAVCVPTPHACSGCAFGFATRTITFEGFLYMAPPGNMNTHARVCSQACSFLLRATGWLCCVGTNRRCHSSEIEFRKSGSQSVPLSSSNEHGVRIKCGNAQDESIPPTHKLCGYLFAVVSRMRARALSLFRALYHAHTYTHAHTGTNNHAQSFTSTLFVLHPTTVRHRQHKCHNRPNTVTDQF